MVVPGHPTADGQPDSTPDDPQSAQEPVRTFGFRVRQLWACLTCGTTRQWGTVRFSKAIAAAKEAGEVIVHEPILWCAGCKNNRPHVWSSDEGVS